MTDFKTVGFHHVTMVSRTAVRTVGFYRDLLGLPLVKRTVNFDDPSSYHLYFADAMGAPGSILTFFEWPDTPRGRWGVGGVHHVALSVDTVEGLLMWKRRLTDSGLGVTGPYDRGYFNSIYFSDPDGQILEIATQGPGYSFDEPANQLGREVMQPADFRLRGGRNEREIAERTYPDPVESITDEMALRGIHHISAISDDLSEAHDFYTQALGLSLVKQTFNQDDGTTKHFFWASYDGSTVSPGSSLTLFQWPASSRAAREGFGQTHHIAFRARTRDEQAAWREHLLTMGLEVTTVQDRKYFESIYFRSPDGLLLEIATDAPGFTVDEPLSHMGRELMLPEWLEPRRPEIEAALTRIP